MTAEPKVKIPKQRDHVNATQHLGVIDQYAVPLQA